MTLPPRPTDPIVDVRDVFVAFRGAAGAVMALRGADLAVLPGERLLVQGPNGSGKSTLLRVITGEQTVVAGSVQVGGATLHELDPARRRQWRARNVGFIDQHARRSLLPEQRVIDNVALQLRLTGSSAAVGRAQARTTLDRLGLGELADRTVAGLSGGEAQRVAICAAVAHAPRLVLADEPTGELDEHSARTVYEMLTQIAADGTSVILVSHDPRSDAFADRAVRVRDGRVAEQWRPGAPGIERVPDSRGWVHIPPAPSTPAPSTPAQSTPAQSTPSADAHPETRTSPWLRAASDVPLVALTDVAAAYPSRRLFHGLELEIRTGEWVVVTGESGSGKSTLLSLVAGLVEPAAGTVAVGGISWTHLDRTARAEHRRRWVALAPQRPSLVEALTVRENLELTQLVRGGSDAAAESATELVRTAARLGLSALLDQPTDRLSGGERQRVALARCLISGVQLLVLDEPTSQQDEASAALVISVLRQETAAGRAVLAATHDPRLTGHATSTIHLVAPVGE